MWSTLGRIGRTAITLGLVALITGAAGAYAVNKVTSKQIAKSAIKSKHVRDGALTGTDVKDGSLSASDIGGGLPRGETGPAGAKGEEGPQGEPGTSVFDETIPSGETVYGTVGAQMPLAAGKQYRVTESFPVPSAQVLDQDDVNFAAGSDGEDDPECTGSHAAPTAPPGKVCIYTSGLSGNGTLAGFGDGRFGFGYEVTSSGSNPDFVGIRGSWAYTAP